MNKKLSRMIEPNIRPVIIYLSVFVLVAIPFQPGLALAEAINTFLGALSEEKRNIFLRRYWYLDTISDIAGRFDMSRGNVKTTLLRLRRQLRAHLEKEGYSL